MMPQTMLGSGATSEACRQEDEESSSSENRKRDKHLHSGATWLVKLPKVRLQQLVEAVDKQFDSVLTAEVEPQDLARVLWCLARTRPNTKVCYFRAKTHKD